QPGIVLKNKNAVIVAHSRVFFEPVAYLLRREGVSAEFLSPGSDVDAVKNADIVIIAVGHENFLAADNIKNGAIVIDVGINKTPHGVVGDVDAEAVRSLDGFITPVPGGVGPVTVASLLANTAAAVARRP
ncbi:MAG: bifunctional 5,10-methylene-tetrahydrofolate dehydrogenase/5,10-methylene-tetrahydrofolate cyclohydrolase, partial [bacterium]|nr:bifunctional 5,10-methylene-tetrahydrofolate dehydrogenase/5,10-methylene-tetrahydrofolate cyclohydrolase [bacterium]